MQGTVAVSDGITVWAFRYSSQRQTRSLFHSADIATPQAMYPDIGVVDERHQSPQDSWSPDMSIPPGFAVARSCSSWGLVRVTVRSAAWLPVVG